jgi:hypothetical protein
VLSRSQFVIVIPGTGEPYPFHIERG